MSEVLELLPIEDDLIIEPFVMPEIIPALPGMGADFQAITANPDVFEPRGEEGKYGFGHKNATYSRVYFDKDANYHLTCNYADHSLTYAAGAAPQFSVSGAGAGWFNSDLMCIGALYTNNQRMNLVSSGNYSGISFYTPTNDTYMSYNWGNRSIQFLDQGVPLFTSVGPVGDFTIPGKFIGTNTLAASVSEGTWTVDVTVGGVVPNLITKIARYKKMGRIVHIYILLQFNEVPTGVGPLRIKTTPYTVAGEFPPLLISMPPALGGGYGNPLTGIVGGITAVLSGAEGAGPTIYLQHNQNVLVTNVNIPQGYFVAISGSYETLQ